MYAAILPYAAALATNALIAAIAWVAVNIQKNKFLKTIASARWFFYLFKIHFSLQKNLFTSLLLF